MPIYIHSEHPGYTHKKAVKTKDWLESVILAEGQILGEINIIFVGDEELRKINMKYLKHDYYTDVISFEYSGDNVVSGDIFISFDQIVYNSNMLGVLKIYELHRVMVHGFLHLLGYGDKTKKEKLGHYLD